MDCPCPGLLTEHLVDALTRIPFRSLYICKCVSKGWCNTIEDPLNCKKLAQTLEGFFYEPHHRRHVDGDRDDQAAGNNHPNLGFVGFVDLPGRSVPLVDPTFSYLPGIENLRFMDSCNGMLLLECGYNTSKPVSYTVCNPAIGQWLVVPDSDWIPPLDNSEGCVGVYLIYDPVVSPHFHLIQYWAEEGMGTTTVNIFSSKAGVWTHSETDWIDEIPGQGLETQWHYRYCYPVLEKRSAVINGMLYILCDSVEEDWGSSGNYIVEMDVNGKTQRIIHVPFQVPEGTSLRRTVFLVSGRALQCLTFLVNHKGAYITLPENRITVRGVIFREGREQTLTIINNIRESMLKLSGK